MESEKVNIIGVVPRVYKLWYDKILWCDVSDLVNTIDNIIRAYYLDVIKLLLQYGSWISEYNWGRSLSV